MKNKLIQENILNLIGLFFVSASLVTVIGFYDEGHAQIYGSFSNYISSGGYPPSSDYIVWTILGSLPGIISFNLISAGLKKSLFRYRFLLAFVCSPLFFMSLLVILGIFSSIINA